MLETGSEIGDPAKNVGNGVLGAAPKDTSLVESIPPINEARDNGERQHLAQKLFYLPG